MTLTSKNMANKKLERSFRKWMICLSLAITAFPFHALLAQDSIREIKRKPDKFSFLTYVRVISDANKNVRTDQNFIGNLKLCKWLRLEAGFRKGERPSHSNSYYHYKVELQSNYFRNTIRAVVRISDNIINFPIPSYRKTNKLIAFEAKYMVSRFFQLRGGLGYLFSSRQDYVTDVKPTFKGVQSNYPIFKVALRYRTTKKGDLEIAYGSYDVFNPYYYSSPFFQLSYDRELSELCSLYSYFRYQYNNNVLVAGNYFFCLGIQFHLVKDH